MHVFAERRQKIAVEIAYLVKVRTRAKLTSTALFTLTLCYLGLGDTICGSFYENECSGVAQNLATFVRAFPAVTKKVSYLKVAEKVLQGHMIKPYLLLQDSVWICWESHYDE